VCALRLSPHYNTPQFDTAALVLSIPDEDYSDCTATANPTTASTATTSPTTATTSDACINYYNNCQPPQQQQEMHAAQRQHSSFSQSQTAACRAVNNATDDVTEHVINDVSTDVSESDSDSTDTDDRLQCAGDEHYDSEASGSAYCDSGIAYFSIYLTS
jgi:hypothetical protein